jgi:membrane protease YdiL (CAAX protease family)
MPRGKFGFGRVLCALGATVVFVMIMAPLGQSFTHMWNTLTGSGAGSGSTSNPLAMLLFAGILTPIMEELIFRRFLLGRLRPLGEGFAILLSSAIFAVFHMNFTQIFFTFFCGLVWGYVYCRSGRFWHVCFLHIAYNTLYGLLLPYLTEWSKTAMGQISSVGGKLMPEDVLPYIGNLLIVMAWGLLLAVITALAVLGVIALSRTLPRLKVDGGEFSLTRKEKLRAVFTASGFIAMLLVGAIFLVSHVTRTPVLSMLLPR